MGENAEELLIVGASLAGATVATSLRDEGFEGKITLIGEEPHPPYERPPLSKGVLQGTEPVDGAYLHAQGAYRDAGIDLRVGRVSRVDVEARTIDLEEGDAMRFDRLVLATGGRPKRPPIPGIDLPGVRTLRTIDDALSIREAARSAGRAVVVGLGFIGSEVAASLRSAGIEVTAVENAMTPLAGPLGSEVGGLLEQMHRDHGVRLVLGEGVAEFQGSTSVERVVTSTGRRIDGDLVVVGLGMQPNVEVVLDTPIEVSNGVVVDEFGRTSVPGIYATGDVANHWHPLARTRLRVEHWNNAVKQSKAVAREITGRGEPYGDVHFFWTDHYGEELKYYGLHEPWDDIVIRGNVEERDFVGFYLNGGRVTAATAMGRAAELRSAKALIATRARPSTTELGDETVDLSAIPASIGSAA